MKSSADKVNSSAFEKILKFLNADDFRQFLVAGPKKMQPRIRLCFSASDFDCRLEGFQKPACSKYT